jgi:hypothetical protein
VPFFEEPSLTLFSIEEEFEDDTQLIKAFWKLRYCHTIPATALGKQFIIAILIPISRHFKR